MKKPYGVTTPDQDRNDGNDDQQLDQSEGATVTYFHLRTLQTIESCLAAEWHMNGV